jgi:hypothetical protein
MTDDTVIGRLAAANPIPPPVRLTASPTRLFSARRHLLAAALVAAAISLPAVAFADDIGGLLGFSTQGQPVATSDTSFTQVTRLHDALRELGFPSTLQLLDERDGISFYAARRADGTFCFAVDSTAGKGVGCDLGSPSGAVFPSPQRPIVDFSRFSHGARLAGFAADGIASVALVDASGATIASAPVVNNVYAVANPPAGAAGVEARDTHGTVVYGRSFEQAP